MEEYKANGSLVLSFSFYQVELGSENLVVQNDMGGKIEMIHNFARANIHFVNIARVILALKWNLKTFEYKFHLKCARFEQRYFPILDTWNICDTLK